MTNRYAQRVFAEHPMAMWSFDDKTNYVNLIGEPTRDISAWTLTNATASLYTGEDKPSTPFFESITTEVSPTVPTTLSIEAKTAASVWVPGDIYPGVPVSSSMFVYVVANSIDYIDFGSTDGVSTEYTRNYFPDIASGLWVKVSHFDLQYERLYFNIVTKDNVYTPDELTYLINGLSVYQYGEGTSTDSLGIIPTVPSGTEDVIVSGALPNDPSVTWYEEKSIGVSERSAYHVVKDNRLLSYNSAMPIAYGSSYLTKLRPLDAAEEGDHPSLVFDGCGMFTDQGRYDTYTLEFWMRVGGTTTVPRKIVGPAVAGNLDGLFICSSLFILSVGNKFVSYDIGKFGDPMLIHIVYSESAVYLMVNGEVVATVSIDAATVDLVDDSNQWLGFYSYADIDPIEIDVVSLFGYAVPTPVAKKRFVLGQGVGSIGLINSQYDGTGIFSDFSTSNVTNAVSYPSNMFWEAGSLDGLTALNSRLTAPESPLPQVVLKNYTQEQWYGHLYTDTTKNDSSTTVNKQVHFNFRPTAGYDGTVNYAYFSDPNLFCKGVDGIALAFKNTTTDSSVADKAAEKTFLDSIGATTVLCNGSNWETDIDSIRPVLRVNNKNSSKLILLTYLLVINGTQSLRTIFVNRATNTTYLVNSVFFKTRMKTVPAIAAVLTSDEQIPFILTGSYDSSDNDAASEHRDMLFTTYTYLPKKEFGHFYEDIGIRGTWEDYIPLGSLAGVVKNFEGDDVVAIDSIQYNIGNVAPKSIENATIPSTWTYADLSAYYSGLTLGFLYLGFFTGYTTYNQLKSRSTSWDISETIVSVDTTEHFIKSYASLQNSKIALKQRQEISSVAPLTQANSIYFQAFSGYEDMLFEVADGAILVPPRDRNIDDLVLYLAVDFDIPGTKTYPVSVKTLELASFAKNRNDFTPFKAKSGKDIYPVVYNGTYHDNSAFNPFKIDKRGFPYLYLGKESGFTPMGPKQEGWKKGLQFSVPEGEIMDYRMDSLQFWIRRGKLFPENEIPFLEFNYTSGGVYFTMAAFKGDNTRGIIRVYGAGGVPFFDGTFLQNGNIVTSPVVDMEQWNAISYSFSDTGLSLGGVGNIRFYPGLSYNNVSYFAIKQSLGGTQINYRSWTDILAHTWGNWKEDPPWKSTWGELMIEGTAVIKPKELSKIVYETYVGTQSIRVDAPRALRCSQDSISTFRSSSWSTTTLIPV